MDTQSNRSAIQNMGNIKFHQTLAGYFLQKPLYLDEPTLIKPHVRKLVELPWQQTKAEMWDEVTGTLCNLDFIQAKAAAKMTYELVKDFNAVLQEIPDNAENIRKVKEWHERMDKYARDLIACANRALTIEELKIPDSIIPWTQKKTIAEIERMKNQPTRSDKLNAFLIFLGIELNNLQKYAAEIPSFSIQLAWNYSEDGPVGKEAEQFPVDRMRNLILYPQPVRPFWNPLPMVLKTCISESAGGRAISISADGKLAISDQIISGSFSNSCVLWDLCTGQAVKILKHAEPVQAVCITPDGKYALTSSGESTFTLWNTESGQVLKIIEGGINIVKAGGQMTFVSAITMTPDRKFALSGSLDNSIILWDLDTGQILKKLIGHTGYISSVSITPDGRFGLSGSWDTTCILWDLESGQSLKIFRGHDKMISSLSMTPDCRIAVSASWDKKCIVWNLVSGQMVKIFKEHTNLIHSVDITADGRLAVSGSSDNTCLLWEPETGQVIKKLTWHYADYNSVKITPDGTRVFSASKYAFILWNSENGHWLKKEQEDVGSDIWINSITPDRKYAVTASAGKSCIKWNLDSGKIEKILDGHISTVLKISTVPESNCAISCSNDRTCILWDLDSGTALKSLQTGDEYGYSEIVTTPDGKRAFVTSDHSWFFWNLKTGQAVKNPSESSSVNVILTPDGRLAVYDYILLDLETGRELHTYNGLLNWPVLYTPDGKRIISGSSYGDLTILNPETGEELKRFSGHKKFVSTLGISPDGRFLFSGSGDHTCILWDLTEGKIVTKLSGFAGYDDAIHFTPDAKRAVLIQEGTAGYFDNSIILLDLDSGETIARFAGTFQIEKTAIFPGGIIGCCHSDLELPGQTAILHLHRDLLRPGQAIVTARHIWDFEGHRFRGPFADCPLCGTRFQPGNHMVDTIRRILLDNHIGPDDSPCLSLPCEAWDEPALLSNCPGCGEILKFNPFLNKGMDNARIEVLSKEFKKTEEEQIQHSINEEQKIQNNLGIYAMQFGEFEKAYEYFFKLVYNENLVWKEKCKLIYKSNFLLSLLQLNKEAAYLNTLKLLNKTEVQDEKIQKIIRCYVSWKKAQKLQKSRLPFFKRVFDRGNQTSVPLKFDFPPGEYDFD
jgi:WD40 repeat protein